MEFVTECGAQGIMELELSHASLPELFQAFNQAFRKIPK